MSLAEAQLSGQHAERDHIRRYGASGTALPPLPGPPEWFAPELVEIWRNTLAAAAPGSLTALDHDSLVVYCVAVMTHRRLARHLTSSCNPTVELERRLRLAGAELGRASKALGILPGDRIKIPVAPPAPDPDPGWSELKRFPVIAGGKQETAATPSGRKRRAP